MGKGLSVMEGHHQASAMGQACGSCCHLCDHRYPKECSGLQRAHVRKSSKNQMFLILSDHLSKSRGKGETKWSPQKNTTGWSQSSNHFTYLLSDLGEVPNLSDSLLAHVQDTVWGPQRQRCARQQSRIKQGRS